VIRVVLADDQPVVRSGVRMILEAEPDIRVVDETGDGQAAVASVRLHQPDVAVLDIRMPRMDGIAATRELLSRNTWHGAVVMLTTFAHDEYLFGALAAGASGFALKDASAKVIVGAVRSVAGGDGFVAPEMTTALIAAVAGTRPAVPGSPNIHDLTQRERDVLSLVGRGLTNGQIAEALFVEETTVKTHVQRVLGKLALANRVQAAVLASRLGLVE
jgi:DNA-binding NarL/FixJ family response regulator